MPVHLLVLVSESREDERPQWPFAEHADRRRRRRVLRALAKTEEKNIDNRGMSDKKDNEREGEDGGEDEKEAEEKKPYAGNAQDNSQKRPSRDSSSTQQDSLTESQVLCL